MPISLFWGEEDFNIDKAVKDLRERVVDKSLGELGHRILNEPSVTVLADILQTPPMMFGNLLIEVKASNLFMSGGEKASENELERLIWALENLHEKVYVLFICKIPRDSQKKIDSRLKLTKKILNIGHVEEFPAFKFYETAKLKLWIKNQAKVKEINIFDDAVNALIENIGSDLRKLDNELEKLKLSAYPDKKISAELVRKCSTGHDDIFFMAEKLLEGDVLRTVTELRKIFDKDHPLKVISVLQTLLRKWIKIKIEAGLKKSPSQIAQELNLKEGSVINELKKLAKIDVKKLAKLKRKLTQAEYKIKTGLLKPEEALEMCILER